MSIHRHGLRAPTIILVFIAAALVLGVLLTATPSADAADLTPPPIEQVTPADSDVNGGFDGAGASDWVPFAIMLAPFIVLISGLLWVTFGIDRSEGREED